MTVIQAACDLVAVSSEAAVVRILLLTDIPPTEALTAGLVLDQLGRFLPPGSLCCFVVVNPDLDIRISPAFSAVPVIFQPKPNENWVGLPRGRVGDAIGRLAERWIGRKEVGALLEMAVRFGREQKVDRVWAVLQGQTTIRLALPVAERLGVPLYTQVWDSFGWWAKAHRIDRWTAREVNDAFAAALGGSAGCAAASAPMAEDYRRRFGVKAVPVISSHDRSMARTPAVEAGVGDMVTIGMAGQFYAAHEWRRLVHAMNCAGWRVAGRKLRIVVMGGGKPPGAPPEHVSFLGWKTQREAAEILSRCDLTYCPYPFDPAMKEVAELSFPSKLVLYLAAGRPVVFHGPDYSAPARYIRETGAGLCCDRIEATAIYGEIERLVTDPALYAETGRNAQNAFLNDFTLESMRKAFSEFLGVPALGEGALRLFDHRQAGTPRYEQRLSAAARGSHHAIAKIRAGLGGLKRNASGTNMMRTLLRKAVLAIPPLRKLYVERNALQAELLAARAKHESLQAELHATRDSLQAELHAARDSLQAELYAARVKQAELDAARTECDSLRAVQELSLAHILGKITVVEERMARPAARATATGTAAPTAGALYLDLLEDCLVGKLIEDPSISPWTKPDYDPGTRFLGRDWPAQALTMIGTARMRNLRLLTERVLEENVPGDVIETGAWRGGACIYVRGIFHAYGVTDRRIWVADSFRGLPPPDPERYPADAGDTHHAMTQLAVSLAEVKHNFAKYGLLDDQVRFLEGWFRDTLPSAPIERLAVLRLDGDMYESTMAALESLYDKVSPRGFVIIDDYTLPSCRKAVDDFRQRRQIGEEIEGIDVAAVFWRKLQ